jgi:ABC-2 type transport system ATP-binding protein
MIKTVDLSKQFGDILAVDGISLQVEPGQVLALLGQNGAGKTTTVRMLTGILAPTRGWARVAGYDVVREGEQVRARVGVLTEQHGLYLRMTGKEYLDFYARIYRMSLELRRERIRGWLDYFGLSEAAGNPIGQYSKGMRQKLALARALIHEPPVLLLDEPTSAMDPEAARLVRDAIAGLRSRNRAIIICTHNLVEAELLADQIAIIYRGRVLHSGTIQSLKAELLGPQEYELVVRGGWNPVILKLPRGVELSGESVSGPRFRVEDPQAANPLLLRQVMGLGFEVVAMQEIPRSLEQIYLAAMERVKP